jgi:carbon-monoxide dehydrogenase small subunit
MSKIKFKLNNIAYTIEENPSVRLLDILREQFDFVGVKEGCGEGECGACAVLINGKLVNSCLVPLGNVHNQEIMTIEGLSETKQGQILTESYSKEGAVQCGFCTPGMLMASHALLSENPHPTEEQVKIGLSGNLCRCTGYNMIINAVIRASKDGEGLW